jgi:hypothetical protein
MTENKKPMRFEALLGITAIALIVLVALPLLRGAGGDGDRKAVADAEIIARAVLDFRIETGSWPPASEGALDPSCLTGPNLGLTNRTAQATAGGVTGVGLAAAAEAPERPWLEEVPLDPWYRPYRVQLVLHDGGERLVVLSAGADGMFQTESVLLAGKPPGPADACRGDDLGYILSAPPRP